MTEFGEKSVGSNLQRIVDCAGRVMEQHPDVAHNFWIDASGRDSFRAQMHVGTLAAEDAPDGHEREVVLTRINQGKGDDDINVTVSFLHADPGMRVRNVGMVECYQIEGGVIHHDQTASEILGNQTQEIAGMLDATDFSDSSRLRQVLARCAGGYYESGNWRSVHYDKTPFALQFEGPYYMPVGPMIADLRSRVDGRRVDGVISGGQNL